MTKEKQIAEFTKRGLSKVIENLHLKDKEKLSNNIDVIDFEKHLSIKDLNNYGLDEKEKYLDQYYKQRYLSNYGFVDIDDYRKANSMIFIDPLIEEQIVSDYFKDENLKKIYHYTSFDSLVKIVKSLSFRLSSISSLNDRSEMTNAEAITKGRIKSPYHHERIKAFNSRFVMSCSMLFDNLNQWRLYGDDGKGICIEFNIKTQKDKNSFLIGKVVYGKKILNELKWLVQKVYKTYGAILVFRKLNVWNSFIKDQDYEDEKEVRLLYWRRTDDLQDDTWDLNNYNILTKYIFFNVDDIPLEINKIILGPKLPEQELNQGQLKLFLKDHGIKNYKKVEISKIRHYR